MNVLVIGSGGREHAIVWALKQSPKVTDVYCAPGNAGMSELATLVPLDVNDLPGVVRFAQEKNIGLTVVGSEASLVDGIVDVFEDHGLTIFGPSKAAAQLEGSKMFLKHFLKRHHIPTARYQTFDQSDIEKAKEYVRLHPVPLVIKTDGLAAGKGVAICQSTDDALKTLDDYFGKKIFGDAGRSVVIEEFMEGEEASVFAMCDGESYVVLAPAQDHKRIGEHDTGKNTGGMGAYAPAPIVTNEIMQRIEKEVIEPTLQGMKKEGHPYKGCLYVGLMITNDGPKVVEFNVRLGDPETQVVLPLIESDVFDLFYSCATGTVDSYSLQLKNSSAVVVVLASSGYPDAYQKGKTIVGLTDVPPDTVIFHAGTKMDGTEIVTSGGRVLGVTSFGHDLRTTISNTYEAVKKISFEGMYYRHDIGKKALV